MLAQSILTRSCATKETVRKEVSQQTNPDFKIEKMITLAPVQISAFVLDACTQIGNSHNDAWVDITSGKLSRSQYEAQFVARLCAGAKNIASSWRPRIRSINSSLRLNFASVFTHQSPYVRWPINHRCELSDLLVAIIDRTTKAGTGMAVLIQAKQSDTGSSLLSTHSEKEQFDLLSSRPTFDVDARSAPVAVDLTSYGPDNALMYGLTPPDATPAIPSTWSIHRWDTADHLRGIASKYHVSAKTCLADGLVEQLQSLRGWNFNLPPAKKDWTYFSGGAAKDDWSALINYLLEVTFFKPLKQLRNPAGSPPDRGLNEPLYLIGRAPSGVPMFAVMDYDDDTAEEPLDWIAPSHSVYPEQVEWYQTDSIPWLMLGGEDATGGGGGRRAEAGPSPESGPISAIVFEIGNGQEG
jgi:hypothetical protein